MLAGLRAAYGRMRTVAWIGPVASRLVWIAKGALGLPVRWPSDTSIATPRADETAGIAGAKQPSEAEQHLKTQLTIALAAIEGLSRRLSPEPASAFAPRIALPRPHARGPTVPLRISVVVNTYDRAAYLRRTLHGLSQLRHPAFEVIVVNGPSTDDTDQVLADASPQVRIARCPAANLAMSRNIGVALAGGDVVAFIDDDAVPEPDWLDELARAYADPAVAGAGGFIRDRSGVAFQCKVVIADRFGANRSFDTSEEAALAGPAPGADQFLTLTGANASFRRSALEAVGGFDETYAYFLEETDLCLRLADAGYRLVCVPSAEVHHAMASSHLRHDDTTPKHIQPSVQSTTYFAMRHARPSHGLAAVADHLADYAQELRTASEWRLEHRRVELNQHQRMLREIDEGLAIGVQEGLLAVERTRTPLSERRSFRPFHPTRQASDRLRLCLMSPEYPPGPTGGLGTWTRALAGGLADAGHEVTLVTRAGSAGPTVSFKDGVWVHRVAPPPRAEDAVDARAPAWLRDLPPSVAADSAAVLEEIDRMTARRGFDLAMGPIWDLGPAAALALGRLPTVVSLHTPYALSLPFKPEWSADADYRARHVDKVITGEREVLARAPHILANSEAVVADMARAYGLPDLARRAVVIPHGLPDRGQDLAPRPQSPHSGQLELLFVGRLEQRKGADVLLEAAPQVLREFPEARLTLVGDDAIEVGGVRLRQAFERRWAGAEFMRRIRFTGVVDEAELLARYAGCDLFLAPSRYESFGLVFVEAMMFAKPCIGCTAGGMTEVVADGETGLLVPPGDVDALAAAILALARDPQRRQAMGRAGRRRYQQRFTAAAMITATERFFEDVKRQAHDVARAAE